jgi:CHAT domain-containing protein
MPKTSGLPDLSIGPEITLIEQLSGCERMSYPQKADVLHELKNSNLVHFGCHGEADALHPRKSFLYVADGEDNRPERVTVEDLIKIDLPNAQLAYLSACSTAQNKVAELSEGLGGKQGGCKVLQTCC